VTTNRFPLEICLNTVNDDQLIADVSAAYKAGASTIELCSRLDLDGLSPAVSDIVLARKHFGERPGLMVMIRPQAGDFFAEGNAVNEMCEEIHRAATAGADGVVFGLLNKAQNEIDMKSCLKLSQAAQKNNLKITFHRAFEALKDLSKGVDQLIDLGVDRLLYSGLIWGQPGTAAQGLENLIRVSELINNRFVLLVGGGVNVENAAVIISGIPSHYHNSLSFHAHSGAKSNGAFSVDSVKQLMDAIIIN